MRQEILRRGATIENTAPDSGVAPRRGASGAANRGINPTATVGASLRDAKRPRSRDAGNAKGANNNSSRARVHPETRNRIVRRERSAAFRLLQRPPRLRFANAYKHANGEAA